MVSELLVPDRFGFARWHPGLDQNRPGTGNRQLGGAAISKHDYAAIEFTVFRTIPMGDQCAGVVVGGQVRGGNCHPAFRVPRGHSSRNRVSGD